MSDIIFEKKGADFCTPVSNVFLTRFMPAASGSSVKVYLYILYQFNNQTQGLSLAHAAEALGMMEDDVVEAMNYWKAKGLILFERSASSCRIDFLPCCALDPDPDHPTRRCRASKKAEDDSTRIVRLEQPPVYSPEELSLYNKNDQVRLLFSKAQEMMGGSLSIPTLSTVFSFYDYYRLPIDVLICLFEYCRDTDHRNLRYVEKVVQNWADMGISTVEEAQAQTQLSRRIFPVLKALGIAGRRPSSQELGYLKRWLDEYRMPEDLLAEAASRTLARTGKPSFPYMDQIIRNWYESGLTTLEAVESLDRKPEKTDSSKRKGSFFDMDESGTDYDALAAEAQRKLFDAMED